MREVRTARIVLMDRSNAIMGGMTDLQWRLGPEDARLILALLEIDYTSRLTQDQRERARVLAAYLRHRIIRLWGSRELTAGERWSEKVGAIPGIEWRGINGPDE